MHNYAWNKLRGDSTELFAAYEAARLTFCEAFGPEHIAPNIGEFLWWFMPRKVMCGEGLIRAAGTVTRKLEKWLTDNGYATGQHAERQRQANHESAKSLAAAKKVERLLHEFVTRSWVRQELLFDVESPWEKIEVDEGRFEICRVEDGQLWLRDWLGGDQQFGPFEVPAEITKLCNDGLRLSGCIGRVRHGDRLQWRIMELWSVAP